MFATIWMLSIAVACGGKPSGSLARIGYWRASMPANVGEMFYFGQVPWHKGGNRVQSPLTVQQALEAGGLNWEVDKAELFSAEEPPSPVSKRQAVLRLDRPAGSPDRVVGVVHRGFEPLQ